MSSHVPVTRVRVPASSANLGPGFDCLGLALALYSTFEVETLSESETRAPQISVVSACEGDLAASRLPTDQGNLFYRAFADHLQSLHCRVPSVSIRMYLHIPTGRGLGSSATAVVGASWPPRPASAALILPSDAPSSYRLPSPGARTTPGQCSRRPAGRSGGDQPR